MADPLVVSFVEPLPTIARAAMASIAVRMGAIPPTMTRSV